MLISLYLRIWFWITFIRYRNSLPTTSDIENPKMEIEGFSQSFTYEDEGLGEAKWPLPEAFKYVISYRTYLVIGIENDKNFMRSKRFDRSIYTMAKRYFPNWIGFDPPRCTYNAELSDRMQRIRKVSLWKFEKMFDEEI
ncbi:hypothetical protein ACSIGC_02865 [Tenacibaculum sp. ZS6-P6]|uniref:hypothetical protein n=1 Tax=Tenacibaculum sp. ZS6-P6 TaxID=3447503 RepID=UPI003F9C790B